MNLSTLAQLGEFFGGVAVLVTLIYLVVQIKQNTNELKRASARQTSMQNSLALRAHVDHAELVATGCDELNNLSIGERYRFDVLWAMWFQGVEQTFEDERTGLQSTEVMRPYKSVIRGIFATSNGLQWWNERKNWFNASFQKEIEALKEQVVDSDIGALSTHLIKNNDINQQQDKS